MQNVSNLKCPFFGNDGKPIVAGRIHFVKPDTTASDYKGLSDNDYIVIKDKSNTTLPNPLPLDSLGQFETQPFVNDGMNYKMYVDARTGIAEEYDDDTMCWDTQLVIDSKKMEVDIDFDGLPIIESVIALREADPSLENVVVLGYESANDECPPRLFYYVNDGNPDSYGTHVKSNVGYGSWVMKESNYTDVRWFGVKSNFNNVPTDISSFLTIIKNHSNTPVYFPAGIYRIKGSVTLNSVIFEKGVHFYPYEDEDAYLFAANVEERGVKFHTYNGSSATDAHRIIPCFKGTLKVSILSGNLRGFFDNTYICKDIDTLFIDSFTDNVSSSDSKIKIKSKHVIIKSSIPSKFVFEDCVIERLGDSSVCANNFITGEFSFSNGQLKCGSEIYAIYGLYEDVGGKFIFRVNVEAQSGLYVKGRIDVCGTQQGDTDITKISNGSIEVIGNGVQTTISNDGIITGKVECNYIDAFNDIDCRGFGFFKKGASTRKFSGSKTKPSTIKEDFLVNHPDGMIFILEGKDRFFRIPVPIDVVDESRVKIGERLGSMVIKPSYSGPLSSSLIMVVGHHFTDMYTDKDYPLYAIFGDYDVVESASTYTQEG